MPRRSENWRAYRRVLRVPRHAWPARGQSSELRQLPREHSAATRSARAVQELPHRRPRSEERHSGVFDLPRAAERERPGLQGRKTSRVCFVSRFPQPDESHCVRPVSRTRSTRGESLEPPLLVVSRGTLATPEVQPSLRQLPQQLREGRWRPGPQARAVPVVPRAPRRNEARLPVVPHGASLVARHEGARTLRGLPHHASTLHGRSRTLFEVPRTANQPLSGSEELRRVPPFQVISGVPTGRFRMAEGAR